MSRAVEGGWYRHWKGGLYRVESVRDGVVTYRDESGEECRRAQAEFEGEHPVGGERFARVEGER